MKLIGLSFDKLNLEKKSDNFKGLKVTTGIDILDVKEIKTDIFNSQEKLLAVKFEYDVNYEKEIAHLKFRGNIILSLIPEQLEEVLKQWKEKKIPEKFRIDLFNLILKKATLKALQFEEEFRLPLHISMPFFKTKDKKDD